MNIKSALAALQYSTTKQVAKPAPQPESAGGFFSNIAADFAKTLQQTEKTTMSGLTGGADPHALVQALAQTELAVETAVTIRDRVVEAYQEILRMPV